MSLLTLDVGGANEMDVRVTSSGHAEPRAVGSPRRVTFNGRLRSTQRAALMKVPVILYPSSAADAATIRTMFANGGQVWCNGEVFNNGLVDVLCSAEMTDELTPGLLISDDPWVVNLTLNEVENDGTVGL
jgi:hypothetical protein